MNIKKELQRFGLNPTEWTFSKASGSKMIIQNRKDKEFRLLGFLCSNKKNVIFSKLEIISL